MYLLARNTRSLMMGTFFFMVMLMSLKDVFGCSYYDPSHTMCRYFAKACPGKSLIRNGVTCQERQTILSLHNYYRQLVALGRQAGQSAAVNMKTMMWDDELTAIAQRWADQCTISHDTKRNVGRFRVGQNLAAAWTYPIEDSLRSKPDWNGQIETWYIEVQKYRFSSRSIYPFQFQTSTGHYTQMAWADSYRIGCGYSYYKDPRLGYTKLYVCNYGPGGNTIGGMMYYASRYNGCYGTLRPSIEYPGLCDTKDYSSSGTCRKYSYYFRHNR